MQDEGLARLLPTSPLALALLLYRVWRRLPAAQRRRVLAAVIAYGPQLVAQPVCCAASADAAPPASSRSGG